MAGSVNNVDLCCAAPGPVIEHRSVLGQNGNAALAFELVRIHHALDYGFVGAKRAALAKHGVDQGRLTVVYVRDDRYVANT